MALPSSLYARGENLGLAVDLRRDSVDLDYADGTQRTRTTRAGITLYEPSLPWFQPGVLLGYARATQADNPSTAGMEPSGHYLGLTVRSQLFSEFPVGLDAHASYLQVDVDDRLDGQNTRLRWYAGELALGGRVRMGQLELTAGGYWRSIEGDEISRGTIRRTRTFDNRDDGGYLLITYRPDATGTISARFESGAGNAIGLSFARRF